MKSLKTLHIIEDTHDNKGKLCKRNSNSFVFNRLPSINRHEVQISELTFKSHSSFCQLQLLSYIFYWKLQYSHFRKQLIQKSNRNEKGQRTVQSNMKIQIEVKLSTQHICQRDDSFNKQSTFSLYCLLVNKWLVKILSFFYFFLFLFTSDGSKGII